MPLRALYVDFNSYFASVEQQLQPELRGRPVGVLPVLADTTCCIAASYEAKRCGVKTGTSVRDARRLCPDIRLVEARPAVYVERHHRLVEAVECCLHVERVLSIDEMACRLTGSDTRRERALAIARQIKHAIQDAAGSEIRCSIGIAPNTFLAKVASDMEKPDGLVVIEQADLPEALYGLGLRDLCGIGKAMEQRLLRHGIHSVRALCAAGREALRTAWGSIEGERMHARLRGEELPEQPSQRASVGHSHVLPPELRTPEAAFSVLHRLLQKAAMRLRSYGCVAGALHVKVKFQDGGRWEQQARFDQTGDTLQLLGALDRLCHPVGNIQQQLLREFIDCLETSLVRQQRNRNCHQYHHPDERDQQGSAQRRKHSRHQNQSSSPLSGGHAPSVTGRETGRGPLRTA